ncbi:MAG: preprotein translocase subunit YajC [Syntrophomonadaceae bacterium]|nr:preprotein translocase subunit YajC [Syntrophomonadaceae bacterium]
MPSGDTMNLLSTVFWFFLVPFSILIAIIIIPNRKRRKEKQEFLDSLKVKDKVVTHGGAIGVIEKIGKNSVILRVDDKTRIEFLKEAIIKQAKDLE